jgi:hypothetical protein
MVSTLECVWYRSLSLLETEIVYLLVPKPLLSNKCNVLCGSLRPGAEARQRVDLRGRGGGGGHHGLARRAHRHVPHAHQRVRAHLRAGKQSDRVPGAVRKDVGLVRRVALTPGGCQIGYMDHTFVPAVINWCVDCKGCSLPGVRVVTWTIPAVLN